MRSIDLDIYRDYYRGTQLQDMWDNIGNVLVRCRLQPASAEYAGLLITEWIRKTWGGLILVERHNGDPRDVSRFGALRDKTIAVLADVAPDLPEHRAVAVAVQLVQDIRVNYLGEYIIKCKRLDLLQRDYDIWSKCNTPQQIEQMAREHDISVVRAYQINAAVQNNRNKRQQPTLPGIP